MRHILASFAFACIVGRAALAADDTPAWAKEAAAQAVPAFPAKVSFAALFHEEAMTVDPDGRRVMRERGAIKVLQPNSDAVEAFRTYNTKTGKIRSFQGWLILPTGKTTTFPQSNIQDAPLSQSEVYDESRAKYLSSGKMTVGSIFAYEVVEEEKTVFTQASFDFQGKDPVLISRFSLTLPQGWEMKASVFNRDKLDPGVSGSTYNWELRNLPPVEIEDYSPSLSALTPRVAVSYFPPVNNSAGLQSLKDWTSVSTWLSTLVDPPAQVTDKIRAKALQLTAGKQSDLEKIRAIAEFAQQTNYVAISLNLTRGGGYTPHRSEDTLVRNYGDCKDKATLMRSLLKAVGIEGYLTTISADDRSYVRAEWASPMQFNHAIIAISVPASISLPTVIEDKTLGRLLIFDPTDPITPLGDLPQDEQGSYALVIAGTRGALLTMPVLTSEANRIDSVVNGVLDLNGKLSAVIQRQYFGQSGSTVRGIEKLQGTPALQKRFERTLGSRVPGTSLSQMTTKLDQTENMIAVNLSIGADQFGQSMQGKLFIVRPGLLSSGGEYFLPSTKRTTPIELTSDLRHETIHIKLPAGFKLDELPAPQKIDSPYGTLEARWSVKDDEILMEETLTIKDTLATSTEYAQVRAFFDQVANEHGAPVVLVKQ